MLAPGQDLSKVANQKQKQNPQNCLSKHAHNKVEENRQETRRPAKRLRREAAAEDKAERRQGRHPRERL